MPNEYLDAQFRVVAGNDGTKIMLGGNTPQLTVIVDAIGPEAIQGLWGMFDCTKDAILSGGEIEVWGHGDSFTFKICQGQEEGACSHRKSAVVRAKYGVKEFFTFSPCISFSASPSNKHDDDLADLLRAYDCYIQSAFEARLPDSGWCPVCVREFAENEYEDVWLCREEGEDPFAYMYGDHGGE